MSREIKFRAWADYGSNGEMLPNIQNHINGDWDFGNILMNNVKGTKFSVMQYTGLKGKNGVEIYDGDITKHNNGRLREVKWIGGMFDFQSSGVVCDCENGFDPEEDCEVVGNIHQNPDLKQ